MDTKMKMVDAKSEAQKIAFSPLTFQAVRAALNLGILKVLDDSDEKGISVQEIENKLSLNHYTVSTLLEVLESAGIISVKDGLYSATKVARCFLYDDMTRINMNFVHDVCYQGAFYLQESFINGKAEGLKVFGKWPTIYEGLSQLPQQVRKSWFAFDHFYSDNAFSDVIRIILAKEPERLYDVGCNTGKFELALFAKGFDGTVTLLDLPQQLDKAQENLKAAGYDKNCIFYPVDVLKKETKFPEASLNENNYLKSNCQETKKSDIAEIEDSSGITNKAALPPDAILMSQFLDCFSKEEIISILKKAEAVMTEKSKLYILEPFWDNQRFEAAKLSLTHTSLYFTAIANGNSKMYSQKEMEECAGKAGLKILKVHENIGSHEYTLLECTKM